MGDLSWGPHGVPSAPTEFEIQDPVGGDPLVNGTGFQVGVEEGGRGAKGIRAHAKAQGGGRNSQDVVIERTTAYHATAHAAQHWQRRN